MNNLNEEKCAEDLKEKKFLQMNFPEFWNHSYATKNRFYNYIFSYAKQLVDKLGINKEYLKADRCKDLWESHCSCCFEKITLGMKGDYYCTEDCMDWICFDCFNKYKKCLNWTSEVISDIPDKGVVKIKVTITK